MRDLIDEVLAGNRVSNDRGFTTNTAGLELLRGGSEHFAGVCERLSQKVAPVAADITNATALVSRFCGIDYVLQYLLQEGLTARATQVIDLIRSFPPSLQVETLNVALRMLGSSVQGAETVRSSNELLAFAAEAQQSQHSDVKGAADRVTNAIQRTKR